MSLTRPEGVAIVSKATEPTTRMLMSLRQSVVGRGELGVPARLDGRDARPHTDYFKSFPNINCSFSFVAAGILAGSVRMAFASADPHLQERAFGIADTVAFTTFAAFSAFFTSTETICSTVTESCCGCQQS